MLFVCLIALQNVWPECGTEFGCSVWCASTGRHLGSHFIKQVTANDLSLMGQRTRQGPKLQNESLNWSSHKGPT